MWLRFSFVDEKVEEERRFKMKYKDFQKPILLLLRPPHFAQFLIILKISLLYLAKWSYVKQQFCLPMPVIYSLYLLYILDVL